MGDSSLAAAQRTLRMTKLARGYYEGLRRSAQHILFRKCCHPEWNEGSPLTTIDLIACCGNNEPGTLSRSVDLDALFCVSRQRHTGDEFVV